MSSQCIHEVPHDTLLSIRDIHEAPTGDFFAKLWYSHGRTLCWCIGTPAGFKTSPTLNGLDVRLIRSICCTAKGLKARQDYRKYGKRIEALKR